MGKNIISCSGSLGESLFFLMKNVLRHGREKGESLLMFRLMSLVCDGEQMSCLLQLLPRERKKQEYLDAVKERYKHLPEVKRIVR